MELIRQAKKQGLDVTCETGPHYLVLDDGELADIGTHDELLKQEFDDPQDNVYRHLFETQFNKVLEMVENT